MLHTNIKFLSFIETLYQNQLGHDIECRNLAKGTQLCQQGDTLHKVYIIKEGIIKCFRYEDNTKYFIFEFYGKGEIIGEIEALRSCECFSNVETITDVEVYSFSVSFFKHLCDTNSQFSGILLSELANRVYYSCTRSAYQLLYPIKYALNKLLKLQEQQGLNLSKQDMASYLGIDIRSLNRLLKSITDLK